MSRAHDLDRQEEERKQRDLQIASLQESVVKLNDDVELLKDTSSSELK